MKITAIYLSSSLTTIALALPIAQYNEPWTGFFGPDPGYYPYGIVNPYYPAPPNGPNSQIPPPPHPALVPAPYGRSYEEHEVAGPLLPTIAGPHSYGRTYQDPGPPLLPQPPQPPSLAYPSPPALGPLDDPIQRPAAVPLQPQAPKAKISKPVSEKPRDKKPLADKFAGEIADPTPVPPPQKPVVEGNSNTDDFDKDAIRYHVNVGGIQKGGGGGTTNFHVYSDENGNKRFSDELDEETEKYITENMIPKLGGKRKGGNRGGIWSVFGDN